MTVDIGLIVTRAIAASRFVAIPHVVRVAHADQETVRWEIFLGHLLDQAATRRIETFSAWHVFLDRATVRAENPLLSIYWNAAAQTVFVTRQILTHAFEAFEESPGVIGTRAVQKWVRELVGAISTRELDASEIEVQLGQLVYLAVVGLSRLPITSLESPLPCFSLGELAYFPGDSRAMDNGHPKADRLFALLAGAEVAVAARALEFALRGLPPEADQQMIATLAQIEPERVDLLVRTVFNQAALAPYTGFADRLVNLVGRLAGKPWFGTGRALRVYSFMLRQLCRHLTAFDLSLFHNFGANYPDALFLDSLLQAPLRILEEQPQAGISPDQRLLRRALRGAVLLRKHYEGLRVPDAPTSMGENSRVLPAPFVRVPEEQITELGKRRRTLFDQSPTDGLFSARTRPILEQSFRELNDQQELQELGTALFLDRPLGVLKRPGEVDRTPLVSYVAFSRSLAVRRLATASSAGWLDDSTHDALRARLANLAPAGVAAAELQCVERPGIVSLADANKAAADFVVLRSTRGSLDEMLQLYDWEPLASKLPAIHDWLLRASDVLFLQQRDVRSDALPRFEFFRGGELQFVLSAGASASTMARYRERAGIEVLSPLRLIFTVDDSGRPLAPDEHVILIQAKMTRCT